MYHNFFIHSSVNGYLGCFYVLAIVNSAAVKNGIHVPLKSTHLTFLSEHKSNKNLNLVFGCLHACMLRCFSRVWFFATLWIVAGQAPLSTEILQARILAWVAMLSSRGSSRLRDRPCVSSSPALVGGFFTQWATWEAQRLSNTSLLLNNHPYMFSALQASRFTCLHCSHSAWQGFYFLFCDWGLTFMQ